MKFGTLFDIICDLRGPSEKRTTIRSRVRQWQAMGVPFGAQVGRGAKCDYTPEMVWETLLINELTLCGFPAQTARDYVRCHWGALMLAVLDNDLYAICPIPGVRTYIQIDIPRIASAIEARTGERECAPVQRKVA